MTDVTTTRGKPSTIKGLFVLMLMKGRVKLVKLPIRTDAEDYYVKAKDAGSIKTKKCSARERNATWGNSY